MIIKTETGNQRYDTAGLSLTEARILQRVLMDGVITNDCRKIPVVAAMLRDINAQVARQSQEEFARAVERMRTKK